MRIALSTLGMLAVVGFCSSVAWADENEETWASFSEAIEKGDVDAVSRLIAEEADVNVREPGPWQRSLLHVVSASHADHPKAARKIAKLLVDAGAEVNAEMRSGLTPIHEAARSGARSVARVLVSNGADVNAIVVIKNCLDPDYDANGDTPLDAAVTNKHLKVAALLKENGAKSGAELK